MVAAPVLQHDEQLVIFRLAQEAYGIEIFRVHEIIRPREVTPVPRTDFHIRGLINLRGKTVPVVDLRLRFGLEAGDDTDSTRVIVVESESGNVGIVVDAVSEVMTVQPDVVERAPTLVCDATTEFVRGVAKVGDRLITLLDLDRALVA